MRIALSRVRARARRGGEAGFTLLEVVVAMVVLLIVFTATAGLLTNMLRTTQQARQQQAANQLADKAMEQVRALPYATVIAGSTSGVKSDPDVTLVSGVYYYGTQALDWNSTAATNTTPLDTYPWPTTTTNGTTFTTKTFVTCQHSSFGGAGNAPSCSATSATDPDLDSTDQLLYKTTVVVSWTPNGTSTSKSVSTQSIVFSPKGCQSTLTHPIAAPCEPFFYGSADSGQGTISVGQAPPDPLTGIPAGPPVQALTGFSEASLGIAHANAALQSEQTAKVSAGAFGPVAEWTVNGTQTTLVGTRSTAQAGNDAGATAPSTDAETLSQATGSQTLPSGDGQTSLTLSEGAVNGSMLATSSSGSPSTCWDTASPPQSLSSNSSCGSGKISPGGVSATLTLPAAGTATLAAMSAPTDSDPVEVFTGRFSSSTPVPGHCSSETAGGSGCEGSAVRRATGDLTVGELPTGVPPGHIPAYWDTSKGLVQVTGYSDSATVERGDESANPSPSATVAGDLYYWNGTGYGHINLATATAGTVIPVSLDPVTDMSDEVTVAMSGTITIGGTAASTTGDLSDCASAQCVATASVTSYVVDVVYTVQSTSGGSILADIDVKVNLGQLLASSTYQAAPSGS